MLGAGVCMLLLGSLRQTPLPSSRLSAPFTVNPKPLQGLGFRVTGALAQYQSIIGSYEQCFLVVEPSKIKFLI